MDIDICGNNVHFNRIQVIGRTSEYYIDTEQRYFLKKIIKYKEYNVLEREVYLLNKLKDYTHFPKLVCFTTEYIVTKYIGPCINKNNIPINYLEQIDTILEILKKEDIEHCDIKKGELVVDSNSVLHLVDFGWAKYKGSWSFLPTMKQNIIKPAYNNIKDKTSIINIIQSLLQK